MNDQLLSETIHDTFKRALMARDSFLNKDFDKVGVRLSQAKESIEKAIVAYDDFMQLKQVAADG